ncbi:MAG: TRAP transporter substrate-binding protein [Salinarimonas sp.]|nr:TRAP transporter substrate-binding protein [Salinarimonas sp.]
MINRRNALGLTVGGLAASAVAAPAIARENALRLRMVTSWPRGRAGPGISAQRVAERINRMAQGRLHVELFAAGEIVSAFGVLDAVSDGTVEMGHSAAIYWQGKMPAASFFTTVPFGLGPVEHQAWIALRGGQELWDELYRPFGVRAFMAGNPGPNMGGFFRERVTSLDDLRGRRIRIVGLGAQIFEALGATAVNLPAGEMVTALDRGTIDAVEFLAPASDYDTGLHQHAPYYYAPGFNKPNGPSELLISDAVWEDLPDDLRAIVAESARAEHALALADAHQDNARALDAMLATGNVSIEGFPGDLVSAAREAARDIIDDIAASSDLAGRIVSSYREAQAELRNWSALSSDMARSLVRS